MFFPQCVCEFLKEQMKRWSQRGIMEHLFVPKQVLRNDADISKDTEVNSKGLPLAKAGEIWE